MQTPPFCPPFCWAQFCALLMGDFSPVLLKPFSALGQFCPKGYCSNLSKTHSTNALSRSGTGVKPFLASPLEVKHQHFGQNFGQNQKCRSQRMNKGRSGILRTKFGQLSDKIFCPQPARLSLSDKTDKIFLLLSRVRKFVFIYNII